MRNIFLLFRFVKNFFSKNKKFVVDGDIRKISFHFEDVESEEEHEDEVDVELEVGEHDEPERTTRALPERRETRTSETTPPPVPTRPEDMDYTLVVPPLPERRESTPEHTISVDSSTDELIEFLLHRLAEERSSESTKSKTKTLKK